MDELSEYIAKEWNVVSRAPFAFLIIATIISGLVYIAAEWHFIGVIEQVNSANETLKERLHLREDAMILRGERRSRLPNYVSENKHCDKICEYPVSYLGFNCVASELEHMAKILTS